jgi:NADH-quinone oxidoreductase subunit D
MRIWVEGVGLEPDPLEGQTQVLNMGPQHPGTHGVLRVVLTLEGEVIVRAEPHVGYVHTGIEKNLEYKPYQQGVTLTDRIEYTSASCNNLAFVLPIEKLLGIEIPPRATILRVIWAELSRLSGHLIWVGNHAIDLGAMSVFLYAFREREWIMDLHEMAAGTRMMPSYIRVGGVYYDIPEGWVEKCRAFCKLLPGRLDEYEDLLTANPIWLVRTQDVGKIDAETAIAMGLSGPSIRACGVPWDVRKSDPYCDYETYDFDVPIGEHGDVYDRYLVRVAEMRQSVRIIEQALDRLEPGPVMTPEPSVGRPPKAQVYTKMEELIYHFLLVTEGFHVPAGEAYVPTEGAKGEVGFYIVSDGSNRPYKAHMRAPSFVNLQSLETMAKGHMVPDLIAIIASIDLILGEVDR